MNVCDKNNKWHFLICICIYLYQPEKWNNTKKTVRVHAALLENTSSLICASLDTGHNESLKAKKVYCKQMNKEYTKHFQVGERAGLETLGPQVSKCAYQSPDQSWDGNREY